MSVSADARAIAQRPVNGLTERDSDVFGRVVIVDVQIADREGEVATAEHEGDVAVGLEEAGEAEVGVLPSPRQQRPGVDGQLELSAPLLVSALLEEHPGQDVEEVAVVGSLPNGRAQMRLGFPQGAELELAPPEHEVGAAVSLPPLHVRLEPRHRFGVVLVSVGEPADGVQQDQYVYNDGDRDPDWDAVWEVQTHRDAQGWYAEFRIPFSSEEAARRSISKP